MIVEFINWNVNPEIFRVGSFAIRWYGLLFVCGFITGFYIMKSVFIKEGIKIELLDKLTMYMLIATVVGARLGHCLFYQPDYYFRHPFEILKVWEGGLASHGAGIAIIIALIIFAKKHKEIKYWWLMDLIGMVVALAGFFIRLGNLMNSEIYGIKTNLPWGFVFERENEIVPKHPTQLYEGLTYLLIFFILFYIYKRIGNKLKHGFLFGLFLIMLFSVRFIIEFIKEPQVNFENYMSLNMGQLLSLPFIITGIVLIIWTRRRKNRAGEVDI